LSQDSTISPVASSGAHGDLSPGSRSPQPSAPPTGTAEHVRTRETAIALGNGLKMGTSLIVTWSVALIVKLQVPAHLGPVRQGHFGFAESFATMFFATLGFGIDTYIAKEVAVRPKHASDIVGGIFALRVLGSFVLFAVMAGVLWGTGRPTDVIVTTMIFGVANLMTVINGTLGVVLNTTPRVGSAALSNISAKVLWGLGLLVALHYDAPLAVLALPQLVGEILRVSVMVPATRREADLRFRIDVRAVRAALIDSVPYFVNSLALGILGSLGMSVLEFVRVDAREVGWFAAVQNIAYLCVLLTPLLGWVVMPMLSRAYARSHEEGMLVFRRALEALVVAIVPVTVLISAGSDVLIRAAFGSKYAPAGTGLSILSLMFVMTYMNTLMAMVLIVMRRGWSVTIISVGSVFVTAILILVLVPIGRRILGEGGECAGAAMSVITSEACVFVAMLTQFDKFPLDARDLRVLSKSVALGLAVLLLDRQLRFLGPVRLGVDAAVYLAAALAIRVVRVSEVVRFVRLLRSRGASEAPVAFSAPKG
jgi:O-antigen/teichoic acid export membrane protein